MIVDPVSDYARSVLDGEVIAGPYIIAACKRHFDDLQHATERGFYFDYSEVTRVFRFFEERLKLSEGQFEGKPFILHPVQKFIIGSLFGWKWLKNGHRRFSRAYIEMGKGNGKALALDTPIPTPDGWSTMGDLKPGDRVFDEHGTPCSVLAATEVMHNHDCYKVTFSDGESIIADADHLWNVSSLRTGLKRGPKKKGEPCKGDYSIKTTRQLLSDYRLSSTKGVQAKYNHRVDVAGALILNDVVLPIKPYTLGAWLGDGDSDAARITVAYSDFEIVDGIKADGYPVKEQKKHSDRVARVAISNGDKTQGARNKSLAAVLRSQGLLSNKHIPEIYFRSGTNQRLELLRGLMDTDGYISKTGQCEYVSISKRLSDDVCELVRGLGYKVSVIKDYAKIKGVVISDRYRVIFHASSDCRVFKLERKYLRQKPTPKTRQLSKGRQIVNISPVPSVPVRCISVSSVSQMFLCGNTYIPTHNSPLAGGIGLYGMLSDNEPGAQIYSAGATRDQSDILFQDAVKMVNSAPELKKRIRHSGNAKVWNMAALGKKQAGSFFRPLARTAGKSGSGPRPHIALIDELHEHPDRSVMELLERGFKFRRQPLLLMITNSGSDRNSVCWEEHEHAVNVVQGDIEDHTTFSFVCSLDEDDDPLNDPLCWYKANPLLGTILTEDYIAGVVKQAKAMPSKENNVLRLHFCRWTDAETAWVSRKAWEACEDPDMHISDFQDRRCYAGLDLSAIKDLTAKVLVFEDGHTKNEKGDLLPKYAAFAHGYTPKASLMDRVKEDRAPYDLWVNAGFLTLTPGFTVKYKYVIQDLVEDQNEYDLQTVAYDQWLIQRFEEDMDDMNVELPLSEHPQGFGRRKDTDLWMPDSIETLETLILERRIRFHVNPALRSSVAGATFEESPAGLKRFTKAKATQRIDLAVALAMAVGAAYVKYEEDGGSLYEERALRNEQNNAESVKHSENERAA